jgi:serine O-acetyltransferase
MTPSEQGPDPSEVLMSEIRGRHPRFTDAVRADAEVTLRYRGEPHQLASLASVILQVLRLTLVSDAFLAQVLYRAKARLQSLGVPLAPRVLHRLAMISGQVSIGDPVVVAPGIYIVHGQVVIDGLTEIASGVNIAPFVTIGLRAGDWVGPRIGPNVQIGTGAKLIGKIEIGDGASIGANAVVVDDVAAGETVVGAPARPVVHVP